MKILAQDDEEVVVRCDVITNSGSALLVKNGDDEMWLPLSQVEVIDIINDIEYELSIPIWLAEDREIV